MELYKSILVLIGWVCFDQGVSYGGARNFLGYGGANLFQFDDITMKSFTTNVDNY